MRALVAQKEINMSKQSEKLEDQKMCCGLVMPISSIDGCDEQHWLDVKDILTESIESAGFESKLVSYADDVGIIQKRIIQNLYENPIVVCDVSGKNPNVMFELGMRLAFDKPTIIIKDEKTSYSFDTSPIEHLEYPRDLRFTKIVEFKEALKEKIQATYKRSVEDTSYTTFLKHFGTFTVSKLDSKEVSKEDFIIEELRDLKKLVHRQEMISREQRMFLEPARFGRIPSSKAKTIMKREIIEALENDLPHLSPSEMNSEEVKHMLFDRVMNSKRIGRYFEGPEEMYAIFNQVYEDIAA